MGRHVRRQALLATLLLGGGGLHAAAFHATPMSNGATKGSLSRSPDETRKSAVSAASLSSSSSSSSSSPPSSRGLFSSTVDTNAVPSSTRSSGVLDLSRFPRRRYTAAATPIEAMTKLSAALGGAVNLYVKRDDLLGLTGGGNKTRKLEFVMADAIASGADTIVTCGAVQSNHCRLTLSACIKEGLNCCLVLEERVPGSYSRDAGGNNYLFNLLGAERTVTVGLNEANSGMERLAEQLRAEGRNVYVIPGGASNAIGATGYVACAQEIMDQIAADDNLPSHFDYLVVASGSGGTHAGIAAGMSALLQSPTKVVGISTRQPKEAQTAHIRNLAERVTRHIVGSGAFIDDDDDIDDYDDDDNGGVERAANHPLPPLDDAIVVHDQYVGPGYSLPTEGMEEAVTMFARMEGILLDPVYTGKAAAGLIDLVRTGYFPLGSNVLFLHTGGAPSLYHYRPLDDNVPGVARGIDS